MEMYLVKEEVKIIKNRTAFSKTNFYNDYIKGLQLDEEEDSCSNSDDGASDSDDASESQDEVDRMVLTISDLPVALISICSDSNEHSEKFAKRVEMKLTKNKENFKWKEIELELIIDDSDPAKLDGHFVLSRAVPESKRNILKRLEEEPDYQDVDFLIEVSLCHLPRESAAVSPESLVCLKGDAYTDSVQIPPEMKMWWEKGTGFIYSKVSVKVRLNEKAVDLLYGYLDENEGLLRDGDFTDVEIGCKNGGEIVRCHRAVLAVKSKVLRDKFKEMLEEGWKRVSPWKLKMEMGKGGVEAFLEYVYCGRVSGGMSGCDAALGLLMAAREYQVVGLENKMDELIMGRGSSDFGYFSVEAALDLFLYARKDVVGLKHLRDKAVRVLQNFLKSKSDEILKSKAYQDLFKNQPQVAMELSSLCMQLS